jgi:RimJ/RimL family protein N-acetyltransferase
LNLPPAVRLRRALLGAPVIRRLGPEDFEALAIYAGHHLPSFRAAFMEQQLRGAWTRSEGGSVGALSPQGELVGSAYLGRYADEGIPVDGYWIRAVYVAPLFRGFGLAGRMVGGLLDLAREQGHPEVLVDIRADNAHSLALHQRLGFEPVVSSQLPDLAPLSALDGEGAPRRFFRKRLDPTRSPVESKDP